ncbi:MAG: nuclear transport factor 2 family protein [Myxococcota bacterium]
MELSEFFEIEAIKQLKYKYMRCVDLKRWDELETAFAPEATCSYGGGRYHYEGRGAIIAWLKEGMDRDGLHSSHSVHHPEIELTGPDTATGIWALEDIIIDMDHNIQISGAAFYHDRYVKRDGDWLIEHTGYQRVFEQMESRADRPSLKLTASMWTTGGKSEIDA